ncbi:cytochrome P450 [Rhodococcus koreensis]|uniref:cytochrome P450 n=1 Tax=Rhodococcus koreensis TaxID=99653 RepID=UPI0036722B14
MTISAGAPDILSPEFEADPYSAYEILREDYPVLWHDGLGRYIISRYEDVSRAFKDATVFSSEHYADQIEPLHGRTMLQMDGREHTVHRSVVTPAFRGHELSEKYIPLIDAGAKKLIDSFRRDGSVDLVSQFTRLYPVNVIMDMLALPSDHREEFRVWYKTMFAFIKNVAGDPAITALAMQTKVEFREYMLPLISQRRQNPGADLLSTLCTAEIDGTRFTDDEINSFCSVLFVSAGETTDSSIGSIFRNLLDNPEQLEAVKRDRSLISSAFAETLRFSPPGHMFGRRVKQDVEIAGTRIEAGKDVILLIGAANRDPRKYANPERFDIFRPDLDTTKAYSAGANHTAFGLGRHFCVGAMLSKAEVEIGVGLLLDSMGDVKYQEGFVPREGGVWTRGLDELLLDFDPRTPPQPID